MNAVPYNEDNQPRKCLRYKLTNETVSMVTNNCSSRFMFTSEEEICDRWVFATEENTIAREFKIMCEDRKWQLTSVGTVNSIGQYIGICFFGMMSDRYGRKFIAIFCTLVSTVFGLLRALSNSYIMFIGFEFLDSLFSSGIYGSGFVLGLELMTPKLRPLMTSVTSTFYPLGAVVMGIVAWCVQDWRKLTVICYTPGLLFVLYYWLIPESARWLHVNGKHKKAVRIITHMSNSNRKPITEETSLKINEFKKKESSQVHAYNWTAMKIAFKSKRLLLRMLVCSYCWFTFTLVYYGLSINSIELSEEKYLNFILVNLVEMPAALLSGFIMTTYPRKPTQITTLFLGAIGCIGCQLLSPDQLYMQITLFLFSKFLITISFFVFYMYAAEMYPTELRLSLFSLSSLIGRFGTMLAPQTVLLKQYFGKHAPILVFSGASIIAAMLTTIFPETFNKKLSDTLDEENIDK